MTDVFYQRWSVRFFQRLSVYDEVCNTASVTWWPSYLRRSFPAIDSQTYSPEITHTHTYVLWSDIDKGVIKICHEKFFGCDTYFRSVVRPAGHGRRQKNFQGGSRSDLEFKGPKPQNFGLSMVKKRKFAESGGHVTPPAIPCRRPCRGWGPKFIFLSLAWTGGGELAENHFLKKFILTKFSGFCWPGWHGPCPLLRTCYFCFRVQTA